MLTPADAERLIEENLSCLPIESLPLWQCAGAILRENIYGERDQPPFDRVAMDGIAVNAAAVNAARALRLRIAGMQAAGDPPRALPDPNSCIEIMTGAMLPTGCDAVIPVEHISVQSGTAHLTNGAPIEPWQNIHRRGTDSRQGALLLNAGSQLGAPEIAVAAGAGMPRLRASSQPTIVVISTGNELVEPGETIQPYQVRRSNSYGVAASLRRRGFQRIADDHILDDKGALLERLRFHLNTHDVLVMSGGVSMGQLDLVPEVLTALGVRQVFHKIAQRPGKPMWFGLSSRGSAVFALPGNPVSTLVCLARYVIPALYAAMGGTVRAPAKIALSAPIEVKAPLTFFMPIKIDIDDWARPWAVPCPTHGSGDFTALSGTDGFVELPPGPNEYPKGFVTRWYGW